MRPTQSLLSLLKPIKILLSRIKMMCDMCCQLTFYSTISSQHIFLQYLVMLMKFIKLADVKTLTLNLGKQLKTKANLGKYPEG